MPIHDSFIGSGGKSALTRFSLIPKLLVLGFLVLAGALTPSAGQAEERIATFSAHDPASTVVVDHSAFAAFLERYLVEAEDGVNRVRYGAVSDEDRRALQAYIADIAAMTVTALNRDEQFALWANLYNAITIEVILEAYPVKSIRAIRPGVFAIGPWGAERVTVEGESLSLDDIEHRIMRGHWQDNRVHYAVNCASIGCPNLRPEPFTGAGLDDALDQAARAYVNHPRGVSIEDGELYASKIYRWYGNDFGGSDASRIAHFKQYAAPELRTRLDGIKKISGFRYDWALNEPDAP